MRIIIIRHGDPNYDLDCLTEKGKKEAELLAKFLKEEKIDYVYSSPLGRAKETCDYYLKETGKNAEIKEWLQEVNCPVLHEDDNEYRYPWDYDPKFWTDKEYFYDRNKWKEYPIFKQYELDKEYDRIIQKFDELLSKHGYTKEGNHYKVTRSNHETIAIFCHFGVECVMLSRLLGFSPFLLWHSTCSLTSGVTRIITEERNNGYATFRLNEFGSIDHLRRANEKPSRCAMFTECFNDDDRH